MTKKHYEAIARIIQAERELYGDHYHLVELCKTLADYFAQDNPKFDRVRFLKACGIEQESKIEQRIRALHTSESLDW